MPESAFGREFSLVAMKRCVFILYLSKVYLVSCTSLSVVVLYASCCVWGGSLSHRLSWALFTHICEARCPKYYIVCTWVLWTDMWFEHVFESIKTIQWPDLQFGFLWVGGKETITSWLSYVENCAIPEKSSLIPVTDKTGLQLWVQNQCEVGGREGLNDAKSVTQYDISCFLSIICSFRHLFSHPDISFGFQLCIFSKSVCASVTLGPSNSTPPNSSSCIGADMHTHSSKHETLKEGGCTSAQGGRRKEKETQKEKVLMESNWSEESQECYRGRWLGLTDGSVLIQHRHNLLP